MNKNKNNNQEDLIPDEFDEALIDELVAEIVEADGDTGEAAESSHSEHLAENLYCAIFGAADRPELGEGTEEVLLSALQHLTPREEIVVRMYYNDKMSMDSIAKEFGVARARIDEILRTAIRKLRHPKVAGRIRKSIKGD